MHDCMKLLIRSFMDNILYNCMMHVFLNHSSFAVDGAIILSAGCGCIQKGTIFCEV